MIRVLLHYVLPVLLPTVIYIFYMMWARRRALAAGTNAPDWREGPIFWFALAGLLLIGASLVGLFFFGGDDGMDGFYQPPRIEDGKIVPGQFDKPRPGAD